MTNQWPILSVFALFAVSACSSGSSSPSDGASLAQNAAAGATGAGSVSGSGGSVDCAATGAEACAPDCAGAPASAKECRVAESHCSTDADCQPLANACEGDNGRRVVNYGAPSCVSGSCHYGVDGGSVCVQTLCKVQGGTAACCPYGDNSQCALCDCGGDCPDGCRTGDFGGSGGTGGSGGSQAGGPGAGGDAGGHHVGGAGAGIPVSELPQAPDLSTESCHVSTEPMLIGDSCPYIFCEPPAADGTCSTMGRPHVAEEGFCTCVGDFTGPFARPDHALPTFMACIGETVAVPTPAATCCWQLWVAHCS